MRDDSARPLASRIVYRNPHPTDPIASIALGHLAASTAHVLPGYDAAKPNHLYLGWVSQAIAQGGNVTPPMVRRVNDEAGGIVLGDEQIADIGPVVAPRPDALLSQF